MAKKFKRMKTNNNLLHKVFTVTSMIILSLTFLIISSCKSSVESQAENKEGLSKELEDVREELNEVMVMEQKQMKKKIDSVISDFNIQVDKFKSGIEETDRQLDQETIKLIDKLEAQRDTLNSKLSEIENKTEENWSAFKQEMDHDIEQFVSSVKDFFQDNE